MRIERLVAMANDIGSYFASHPDRDKAISGIAGHMKKFWDPRMRGQIVAHLRETGGEGLDELVARAVRALADEVEDPTQAS